MKTAKIKNELSQLRYEHYRITQRIENQQAEASPEMLNHWLDQVNLINRTKKALEDQLSSSPKSTFEGLYEETQKLIEQADTMNREVIQQLTAEGVTEQRITEHCKFLMNNTIAGLLILNDFLSEIINALNVNNGEHLEQILNEAEGD